MWLCDVTCSTYVGRIENACTGKGQKYAEVNSLLRFVTGDLAPRPTGVASASGRPKCSAVCGDQNP